MKSNEEFIAGIYEKAAAYTEEKETKILDVLYKGKKFCGILSEAVVNGTSFKGLVIGVGVNIEQKNIEEARKKTDGKWCLEAENIIKNAGVSSESGLLQKYHEKENRSGFLFAVSIRK